MAASRRPTRSTGCVGAEALRALTPGVFGGLRRIADDGGRFSILDLAGAEGDVLDDLIEGLAPYASAVILDRGQVLPWYRQGMPWLGRILRASDAGTVALAKLHAADAVLANAPLAAAALERHIARLGADVTADVALRPRDAGPWIVAVVGTVEALPAGAAGYLADPPFWSDPLAADAHRAVRRERIADELVPMLQALNALTLDLPSLPWLAATLLETGA